ncbi:MAG: hypothetical protein COB36_12655 [Alphaproteobacteria bacterium]|nr:MAG: hypothetical protein COB36_12655 [Alphaproteobacteria bacterium]
MQTIDKLSIRKDVAFFKAFWMGAMLVILQACGSEPPPSQEASVEIEYIAHASFKFTDSNGVSIVTDPYNSRIWLGYKYPDNLTANAVLISHSHFDHDASYYFDETTEVFREPTSAKIGEFHIQGIQSEHDGADEMKQNGQDPLNTIWIISTDTKKFVHMGDARRLSDSELSAIGSVDVIITNTIDHAEIARLKDVLNASTVIPMHYKIPNITMTGGDGLETIEEWVGDKVNPVWLNKNKVLVDDLPDGLVVFNPQEKVSSWDAEWIQAQSLLMSAVAAVRNETPDWDEAESKLNQALKVDPGNMTLYQFLARVHQQNGTAQLVETTLEEGLRQATGIDWNTALRIHQQLAQIYEKSDRMDKAQIHQDWIFKHRNAYRHEYEKTLAAKEEK